MSSSVATEARWNWEGICFVMLDLKVATVVRSSAHLWNTLDLSYGTGYSCLLPSEGP